MFWFFFVSFSLQDIMKSQCLVFTCILFVVSLTTRLLSESGPPHGSKVEQILERALQASKRGSQSDDPLVSYHNFVVAECSMQTALMLWNEHQIRKVFGVDSVAFLTNIHKRLQKSHLLVKEAKTKQG